MKQHAWLVAMLTLSLTTLPVGAARVETPRPRPHSQQGPSRGECAELALQLALTKARAEQHELDLGASPEELFAGSEFIKAEFIPRQGCVLSVKRSAGGSALVRGSQAFR